MTLEELFEIFYLGSSDFNNIEIWEAEPREQVATIHWLKSLKELLNDCPNLRNAQVKWANAFYLHGKQHLSIAIETKEDK